MKSKIWLLLALSVLTGCANSSKDMFDNTDQPTMLEMHEQHKQGLYGNRIAQARQQYQLIDDYSQQRRITFNDDLRLPNPELEMVVFPKRNPDGSVSPEQVKRFSMYRQVHYQKGVR